MATTTRGAHEGDSETPSLYDVKFTFEAIRCVVPPSSSAKYQVVVNWRSSMWQTEILPPSPSGEVLFHHSWAVQKVLPPAANSPDKLRIALWLYEDDSQNQIIGVADVDVSNFPSCPSQTKKFPMASKGSPGREVEVEFLIAATPHQPPSPSKLRANASMASISSSSSCSSSSSSSSSTSSPPAHSLQLQSPPSQGKVKSPGSAQLIRKQSEEVITSPNMKSVEGMQCHKLSMIELRQWIGSVLSSIQPDIAGHDNHMQKCITDDGLHTICDAPTNMDHVVNLILDRLVYHKDPTIDPAEPCFQIEVIEERLVSALLEVALRAADSDIAEHATTAAKVLREESGAAMMQLLGLPKTCQQGVFPDNGVATSYILHIIQHRGLQKQHEKYETAKVSGVPMKAAVVYTSEETYVEWEKTGLLSMLAIDVPMLIFRNVSKGQDGGMDLAALEQLVQEDEAKEVVPVAVVGRMGCNGVVGNDDLTALVALCMRFNLWLHVEGPATFFFAPSVGTCHSVRSALQENRLNVSLTLSEDEVPGLQQLPGFWVFYGGPNAPKAIHTSEQDVSAIPSFLPGYLRLRSSGKKAAVELLRSVFQRSEKLISTITEINRQSVAGNVFVKLYTAESNKWTVQFTLVPRDHPLRLNDIGAYKEEADGKQTTLERINTINRTIYHMVSEAIPHGFYLSDHQGILHWSFRLTQHILTEADLEKFKEIVLGAAERMISVSKYADKVRDAIEAIDNITVMRRSLESNPLELCALQMNPAFASQQPTSTERDIEDINAITLSLCNRLRGNSSVATFLPIDVDGVMLCSCCLSNAREVTPEDTGRIADEVAAAVQWVMDNDPTVNRIQDELVQRGIKVAEEKLQEANDRNAQDIFRHIPVVGGVLNWWAPQETEGLKFDLKTSILQKGKH